MTPALSICIRGWRGDTVVAAVESALAQTFADLEVVVADDSGRCEDALRHVTDPRLRYHRNETRLGSSGNAAQALSLGRGRYLAMLNDDDELLPTFAEQILAPFAKHPDLGAVAANHYIQVEDRLLIRRSPIAEGRYDSFLRDLLAAQPVSASAFVFTREAWERGERLLPLRDPLPADQTIALRIAALGMPFYYLDAPVSIWAVRDDQVSSNLGMREQGVALWSAFSFPHDPDAEQLRRRVLAEALVSRAAAHLRARRPEAAREDLRAAAGADAKSSGRRRRLLSLLAARPELIGPLDAVRAAYRRLRPYKARWLADAVPAEPR